MTWVLSNEGSYINLAAVPALITVQLGADWYIRPSNVTTLTVAAGPYTTQADALEAIRKLVHGLDATTVV